MPQTELERELAREQATAQAEADQRPPGLGQELWAELENAKQLAAEVSSWGGSMLGLAWLEVRHTLHVIPRMLGLMLAMVPLAGLTWITLSMLLAWLAYVATGVATVGFATLFALQLIVLLLCMWRLKRLRRQASMEETRRQWRLFMQELKSSAEEDSGEEVTGNRR